LNVVVVVGLESRRRSYCGALAEWFLFSPPRSSNPSPYKKSKKKQQRNGPTVFFKYWCQGELGQEQLGDESRKAAFSDAWNS
jgi:hypothetical protein